MFFIKKKRMGGPGGKEEKGKNWNQINNPPGLKSLFQKVGYFIFLRGRWKEWSAEESKSFSHMGKDRCCLHLLLFVYVHLM